MHPAEGGSALPFVLAAAVLLAATYGGWKWWQVRAFERSRGSAIPAGAVGQPLAEFELAERGGQPFRSADMRGKVWVVSYFFTSCTGECMRLNENIRRLSEMPDLADVTFVSITCDPDNDTLDVLRSDAERWGADPQRWLFCRGELEYVKRIARGMNLALFLRGHSGYAVAIGRSGKVRGMYDATAKSGSDELAALLRECLAEEPPAKTESESVDVSG
jgi:protein SCO1/2